MKRKFEMTDAQMEKLLDACKPVPYMVIGGVEPLSPQESANRAWQALADEMGFLWDTVEPPARGEDLKIFYAEERKLP